MSTTFETAKIGDRVWCIEEGWGVVDGIDEHTEYPLRVSFPNEGYKMYTLGGIYGDDYKVQTLFWGEVEFEVPKKPLPSLEVDTKVIVWNDNTPKIKRHFSHFNAEGKIECFHGGMTSWTTKQATEWDNWELDE